MRRWCGARSPPTSAWCPSSTTISAQILRALEESGLMENTRIVYSSDHGDNLGTRGLWGKSTMYEESAGIPMILAGPDVPARQRLRHAGHARRRFSDLHPGAGGETRSARRRAARAFTARDRAGLRAAADHTLGISCRRRAERRVHDPARQVQIHPLCRAAADAVRPRSRSFRAHRSRARRPLPQSDRRVRSALRKVVDPEAVDKLAKSDQQAIHRQARRQGRDPQARHVPLLAAAGSQGRLFLGKL